MACNCVTEEQLNKIYERIGESKYKNLTLKDKITYPFKKLAVIGVMLLITPMLFAYVLYVHLFGDGKISLTKFFGLKKINFDEYASRKQQELQDKD